MNLSNHGKGQFLNEVKLIRSLQHRNLARIIGCCVEGEDDSRFLVYEYVSNQSLDKHLFGDAIFIVDYFYIILLKYNMILFPFLFLLSLAILFSFLIAWFHISYDIHIYNHVILCVMNPTMLISMHVYILGIPFHFVSLATF